MTTLNSRGHEVVSSIPFEPATMLGREPRLSLADQIRRMIRLEQMAHDDEIKDEADMAEDMSDFSDDSSPDGLLGPSPYEVDDATPDGVSASEIRAAWKEQAEAEKQPSAEASSEPDAA